MSSSQCIWNDILVLVLVANAIYWCLFPHSLHCALLKSLSISKCPSHIFHVSFGIICFIISIWIRQGNLLNDITLPI